MPASSSAPSLMPAPLPDAASAASFRPSATQRRFLQLALAAQAPLCVSTLCATVGISRTTYYRWLAQPGFRSWMSAHWVSTLLADGGRLLSIAQSRAETDFRSWRALFELVFDPRGRGLLTAWQQRLAAADEDATSPAPAPLFHPDDPPIDDAIDDALASVESSPDAPPASPPAEAVVTPPAPAESTTCAPKMEHSTPLSSGATCKSPEQNRLPSPPEVRFDQAAARNVGYASPLVQPRSGLSSREAASYASPRRSEAEPGVGPTSRT